MIIMNIDKLKYRSFILNVLSLCHELIHCYDTWFGDGQDLARYCILTKQDINRFSHRTYTFVEKQKIALSNNIKVITSMDKKDKILDKEAIKLIIQALTSDEIKLLNEEEKDVKQKHSIQLID